MANFRVRWTWVQIMVLPLTGFCGMVLLFNLLDFFFLFHKMEIIISSLQALQEDFLRWCLYKIP